MLKAFLFCAFFVCLFGLIFPGPEVSSSQLIDRISSEHIVLRMPLSRESLGRDAIEEIEQCYGFMNRAIGGSLPRKILIDVNWEQPDSLCNQRDTSITIGMDRPDKAADLKSLLLHKVGREVARLGLLQLSGWAQREDTEFLFEGMIEILIHEFGHSSRSLESAWTYCQILDQMRMLGFGPQRAWSTFSAGKRSHRNAAPGVTFLSTFRELQGRDRPIKLFESLKKASLIASLTSTFKASPAELEETWLKKVREHRPADEITLIAEDAPQLLQAEAVPDQGTNEFQIRLLMGDRNSDLLPEGIYIRDERTQRLVQTQAFADNNAEYIVAKIPIGANCPPGKYSYEIIAMDEAGNLRRWTRSYTVGSQ